MKLLIHAPWEVNDYVKELLQEKMDKLDTLYDKIEGGEVFMKLGDGKKNDEKIVEIKLAVPGPDLFATGKGDTIEKAIGDVTSKIRRQLIDFKEKRFAH